VPEIRKCLGFIETVGLAAAMEAADAAVKAANITIVGRELTRGGGMITIKIAGEVGAVKAALSAARVASSKVNKVWAVHLIPRPGTGIGPALAYNGDTLGAKEWLDRFAPPAGPETPGPAVPEPLLPAPGPAAPEPLPEPAPDELPEPVPPARKDAPEAETREISCEPLLESAEATVMTCEAETVTEEVPAEEPVPKTAAVRDVPVDPESDIEARVEAELEPRVEPVAEIGDDRPDSEGPDETDESDETPEPDETSDGYGPSRSVEETAPGAPLPVERRSKRPRRHR
jgi:ethanolamine utilization microcompartment shell protein EutS